MDGTTTTLPHPHPDPFVMVLTNDETQPCPVDPAGVPAAGPAGLLSCVTAALAAGDVAEARARAERLGARLTAERGHDHPDTIGILTVHAWLALIDPATAWSAETLQLLLKVAERRFVADADPRTDTTRVIRNAHALWRHISVEDPETARETAAPLLALLQDDPRRTRDVLEWACAG
ncbi:hypothetical protein AB0C61_29235 [Streptomyces sp. NPDC048680]|uniref:hypothetical protein n=1 Tax=Streptomyces sp. NPDC048680 TaxID=3155492 RepID=UPI00341AFFC5